MYVLLLTITCLGYGVTTTQHSTNFYDDPDKLYSAVALIDKDNIVDKDRRCYVANAEWFVRKDETL